MLLVVDVGNTNTVIGLYRGDDLVAHYRVETNKGRTGDETMVFLKALLALDDLDWRVISAGIVSTVVPPVLFSLKQFFDRWLRITPLVVGPGIVTGMPNRYDVPADVGADRIVNAVAAYEKVKGACVVVDFGTATTFDAVSARGEYLGGAIAPGITVSADALYRAAARLPRVELVAPKKVIGTNTVSSIQSGIVYGYAGLVDAVVERMRVELAGPEGLPVRCLATGGLSPLIAAESRTIEEADEMLTLRGLKIVWERNR